MRKVFKILLYIFVAILIIITGILLYLQSNSGQRLVTKQVVKYLHENISKDIKLDAIQYKLINRVAVKNLIVPDKEGEELLELGDLEVKFNILQILQSKLTVKSVDAKNVTAIMSRNASDSTFNYQYIIDAFVKEDEEEQKVEPKKETKEFLLVVNKINLENIIFKFLDEAGGNFFELELESLKTTPKTLDFSKGIYEVNNLSIEGLTSNFLMDTSYLPPSPIDTSASAPLQFYVNDLELKNVQFGMLDNRDSMFMNYIVGLGEFEKVAVDLDKEKIKAKKLFLENADGVITFANRKKTPEELAAIEKRKEEERKYGLDTLSSNDWKIEVASIRLNKTNFKMDDPLAPKQLEGMDYSHMDFTDAFVHLDDVYYQLDSISGKINHIALEEQSGVKIMELKSDFIYTDKGAALSNLFLQTPHTLLKDKLIVAYSSLDELMNNMGEMNLDVDLAQSKVAMSDLLLFLPESLRREYAVYKNESLNLDLLMKGSLNDLNIGKLIVQGLSGTSIDLKGKIKGLPDVAKMQYSIQIDKLESTAKDIDAFLPEEVKKQINLPESFALNGFVKGGMYEYFPELILTSSDGDAQINGYLSMVNKDREVYDLDIKTKDLNIGRILRMEDTVLGKTSVEAIAKGSYFDPQKMNASVQARVLAAQAMGYNYHDLVIDALLESGAGNFDILSKDENLNLVGTGEISLRNTYPSVNASLDLKNVDLLALNLMTDTFTVQGKIHADFASLNPDYLDGELRIDNAALFLKDSETYLDSIYVLSKPEDSIQNMHVNISNMVFANLTGQVPLTKISTGIMSHIDRHYHLGDTTITQDDYSYDMNLKGVVAYHPIMKTFIPSLSPFDSIRFESKMDANSLNLNMDIPMIYYGNNILDSGYVRVKENRDTFNYAVGFKEFSNDPLKMYAPSVRGLIRNDSIYALVNVKDSALENQFTLGGSVHQDLAADSSLTFIKLFKGLRFDYERWDVDPNNQIVISPQGLFFKKFGISRKEEQILVQSKSEELGSPFDILIKNFQLSNITKLISSDTLLAEGSLQVDGTVDLSGEYAKVDAVANIDQLKAYSYDLGNLKAIVNNPNNNEYKTDVSLKGQGNDLSLKGSYFLNAVNGNNLDFNLNIDPISLKAIEGLTFGALKNSSGGLRGDINIKGKPDTPLLDGFMEFFAMRTTVAMLNAPFKFGNDKIYFNKNTLRFDGLKIYDSKENAANINGTLQFKSLSDYIADINFRANKWHAIQSTKVDNPEFYGDLIFSSNLNVKGDVMAPTLDGSLSIHEGTNFTYALLDKGPGLVESSGIVDFYDGRDTLYIIKEQTKERRVARSSNINVNVDIDKKAKLGLVMDPGTGEGLEVQGQANLNAFLTPDGNIGLTGEYELEDGHYELKFNLITRKFKIQKGSTITLAGDPLEAEANIVAIYKANVAPYDLVEKQVPPEELNYYKQRIPFEVHLKIEGKALEPELDFDIVVSEQGSGLSTNVESLVESKLNELRTNSSEMNKQVFSVLIMNRFLAENPFENVGGGMESAVRQTVGNFLSDQLNQIADNLIEGFELNVDLESTEDYSTGSKQSRTDLNVSASKRLFNDRIKVTVGNNFELEGAGQAENKSVIPGNLAIDYDLTRDGKYQLRAYRTNELRNILDGYTAEAGLNFRLALEYNRFKYIFINRRKELERMRKRREAERENNRNKKEDNKEKDAAYLQPNKFFKVF